MRERKSLLKLGIKTKVLTAFLAVSLISLVIFGFIAFNGITALNSYSVESSSALGDSAVNDSTIALETQAEQYLLSLAVDQADISNNVFRHVESELKTLSELALDLLDHSSIESEPLYAQNSTPANEKSTSVYVLAPHVEFADVAEELNFTSNLQNAFAAVYSSDPLVTQLYVSSDSGISQVYPWTNKIGSSVDARTRAWYTNAQEGKVYWSEPYVDASGYGLMVTCSIAVESAKHNYFWVLGVDVTLATLNQNVVNAQIEALGGYTFILDNNGNMITHSVSGDSSEESSNEFIESSDLSLGNTTFSAIAKNMTEGKMGVTMCTIGESDNYVSYAPLENTHWSLAIVLPVQTVIAPALATQGNIANTVNMVSAYVNAQTDTIRNTFIGLFLVIIALVAVVSYLLARMIVNPIMTLTKGAKAIGAGNLESRVKVTSGDELEALAGSFNKMADNLQEQMAELKRTTAEKERLIKELEIAKGIQQSFLPEKEPEIAGFDIAASNIPAKEVGGDFYDFIPIATDKWGLTIADVSGKGVPAALFMALSRTLVRASATGNPKVGDAIEKANDLICADSKSGMFVTLFYAILDAKKKSLRYVNAGHNPPLLKHPSGGTVLLKADGIALGVIDGIKLEEAELQLESGDVVTLFTDGVTEAINTAEEQFGQQRLLDIIEENRALPAKEILHRIQAAVEAHSGGQPQFDDITLMIIKVT
ncbi:MAG TPA: SpoIIE family protein phosphatase [Candidatus Acidoferrales bacterium]|nr:SpoIIE family protein phosphatase [Candidatus Acidoferrales bacterium]